DDLDQLVVRQVDVERRHRNEAFLDRLEVRISPARPGDVPSADPVDLATPGVLHPRDLLVEDAAPQMGDPRPFYLIARDRREVDVQQRLGGKVVPLHDPLDETPQAIAMAPPVLDMEAAEGDGDDPHAGRNACA